jgi:hypothetical protein
MDKTEIGINKKSLSKEKLYVARREVEPLSAEADMNPCYI